MIFCNLKKKYIIKSALITQNTCLVNKYMLLKTVYNCPHLFPYTKLTKILRIARFLEFHIWRFQRNLKFNGNLNSWKLIKRLEHNKRLHYL